LNGVTTLGTVVLGIIALLLSSLSFVSLNQAQGQSLGTCPVGYQRSSSGICVPISSQVCPIGYQRNVLGICEPVSSLQSCPVGYQRSISGFCVPIASSQSCPIGYQQIPPGFCVPDTSSQSPNPYGYPITTVNPYGPQTALSQPQTTFTQPSPTSTASLVSPTLTNPSTAQMSPWFPSLPAIACGGTTTMTTIGSIERDSDSGDNNNNNNGGDDDDDNDKKDYAFQIESDGGPSADPESVDGTVYAGEKNIERNNGRDFDIKDVFNDCQVSMFNND
jgi:hypothetical protein